MSAPKTYLQDPEFEDQIAPRSWLSAFYIFRERPSAPSGQHQHFVERLRQNLDEAVRRVPRFGAELEEQPDGRIRLAVVGQDGPGLLHESSSWESKSVDELLRLIERPGAPRSLLLPDPARTARVDVLTAQDGICVVFRAHHSVADGATFAMFTRSVAEGGPLALPATRPPPLPPTTTAADDFVWFQHAVTSETKLNALKASYLRLGDRGGPAQPAEPHRGFAPPTQSRTYRVSRAKCKAQIANSRQALLADDPGRQDRECTVFAFLAARLAAHALAARLDAGMAWGRDATIWIPVDVRRVVGREAEAVGNTVVPAAVDINPPVCFRASRGVGDEEQRRAVEFVARAISDAVRLVRTRWYLVWRKAWVQGIADPDVRDLGVGFRAADCSWVHVRDARRFGADVGFPYLGKADAVRWRVPGAPGIQLHPTREGDDELVLTVTLPQEAMEDLEERRYFGDFMKEVEAAPSE